ncbi:cryptochrome/photolyase family protein [uncultured Algimonas sp.]|uniref:cryptochrome/photolyase family protein n=1 Tax=uncultured Algimonas sp. TaxID=1547920 RepID=UPI002601C886|nr:cryptochrome/photolyase family protein [uncultured Algimonas sp.]
MTTLIPLFADQLSHGLSALQFADRDHARVLMVEVKEEARSVPHHRTKLIFLFSAMRHFAEELREDGWAVDYVELTDPDNTHSFTTEVERALDRHDVAEIAVTWPGNHRVLEAVRRWEDRFGKRVTISPDDRFVCGIEEFADWAEDRKQLRMEYFYREMRRKTGLLMTADEKPEGGEWNYDKENRKPAKEGMVFPETQRFQPDGITRGVIAMVKAEFPTRFGHADGFFWGVSRADALVSLDNFLTHGLPQFGDYQDAMVTGQDFLFHSLISPYLNAGLLTALEVCQAVEARYKDDDVPINAAEGYIRQIIGWREYVRGIYWMEMPGYEEKNFFGNTLDLPEFYWTGETDMECLRSTIGQTIEHAYAHHIQRLMITGNFALLIGADPHAVHEWYLSVYLDAFEWVELPNTLGMSQYGDGGLLGSKPYAASGAYINRMSDYCGNCRYKVTQRVGEDACPFNSLYWHFVARNEDKLRGNRRMSMVYRNLDRMDGDKRDALLEQADGFIAGLKTVKAEAYL